MLGYSIYQDISPSGSVLDVDGPARGVNSSTVSWRKCRRFVKPAVQASP